MLAGADVEVLSLERWIKKMMDEFIRTYAFLFFFFVLK